MSQYDVRLYSGDLGNVDSGGDVRITDKLQEFHMQETSGERLGLAEKA